MSLQTDVYFNQEDLGKNLYRKKNLLQPLY